MSTESGKVSLEVEVEYCFPLAVFDRVRISLAIDFCKESETFVTQYSYRCNEKR
jgi:hypothetical protein